MRCSRIQTRYQAKPTDLSYDNPEVVACQYLDNGRGNFLGHCLLILVYCITARLACYFV